MASSKGTLHTWVGALVVVLGIAFILFSYASGSRKGEGANGLELTARFRAVDGITVGSPVLLAGIEVGQVTELEFDDETYSAILTMALDRKLELPYDSAALISSDGVFGGKYIRIEPGADVELLENGDVFEFTQDSVIIEELLEKIVLLGEERRKERQQKKGGDGESKGELQ